MEKNKIEIKEMNFEQIETRKQEIKTMLDGDMELEALEALTNEVDALEQRRLDIKESVETRAKEIKEVVETEEAVILETRNAKEEKNTMTKEYGTDSMEYRNGFMKTLLGQELSEVEERAYLHTTVNTEAVIPKELQNMIYSNMEEQHPILADVQVLRSGAVISIAKHTAIVAGDARVVAEGEANEDEENTFVNVALVGKKFSKHIDISYELDAMSIPAFEDYLVQEIGARLGAAMAREIVRQIKEDLSEDNVVEAVAPGTLDLADVLGAMGALKGAGKVNIYTNNATLYGAIATLDSQHFGFLNNAQENISGQLLGNSIKSEDALDEGDVLFLDPKQFVWNEVRGITFETDRDIKKGVRTIAGHALASGTLTNDKAGSLITVGSAA